AIPFGGSATVGGKGIYLNGIFAASTVAHELGHNHGLQHAHAWRPSSTSAIGAGTHLEYGDTFDIMGFLTPTPLAHFNTKSKADLHFLEAAQTQKIETTGVYRLHRHDHAGAAGAQALRIAAGDYEYWVEHRRLQNSLWAQHASRFQSGVQLRWGRYTPTQPGPGTYLLDATPRTPDSQADAPLMQGETFTDLPQGISISPVGTGGSSPEEWIDVQVTYGALPGSGNRDPVVEFSFPSLTVPARTDLPFRAVVSDPDGDATTVRWDFDDETAAQFGASLTHRFAAGGTYRVSCIVTDGRGGRTARSVTLTVDDPLQSWTLLNSQFAEAPVLIHTGKELLSISESVRASTDGITWTHRANLTNLLPLAVAGSGTRYVAVGRWAPDFTRGIIYTSADGVAWELANIPRPPALKSVAFGAGRFVAVGLGGNVMHSVDGVAWTYAPAATVYDLNSICFAAERFVAVGDSGVILTSRDGLAWQAITLGSALHAVAYFRGRWHAAASNALWSASADARDWTVTATPTLLGTRGLHAIGDEFLISRGDFDGIQ
ncbi:MAG TPA: PKD domain-containing protein, partial [Opitutaceae bacterium]